MSAKWRRSKQWDQQHLQGPLRAPVRWLLQAFSSITLAVVLLILVALYGLLASVPIGLLAHIPTWTVIALSCLAAVVIAALALATAARTLSPKARPALHSTLTIIAGLLGALAGAWAWSTWAWPSLKYDPATGAGLRLFANFIATYESTTIRRLPGIELTELEFYSAWPLRLVLLLFVANMFIATVRRIEFNIKNAGVLTVHAGIVVIALASVYYQAFKQEGDTILLAGSTAPSGTPAPGPPQPVFYDATRVVLWASQTDPGANQPDTPNSTTWEQRSIPGLPRYNAYNLNAGIPDRHDARLSTALSNVNESPTPNQPDRPLSINLPRPPEQSTLDADIQLRVIGYAPYAELQQDTRLYTRDEIAALPLPVARRPMRELELIFPPERAPQDQRAALRFTLSPDDPVRRSKATPAFAIELSRGISASRWNDLTTPAPQGATDVLVVELPSPNPTTQPPRVVIPANAGAAYTIGETGWEVAVRAFLPEPPFPIVTPGYEGAASSVAILRITQPDGAVYDRWVYSRFPELNQDLISRSDPNEPPTRRDADPAIRVGYLDLNKGHNLNIHIDEVTPADSPEPRWRLTIRQANGSVRSINNIKPGQRLSNITPGADLIIRSGWAHSEPIERPVEVPVQDRDNRFIGTHDTAKLALEISVTDPACQPTWSTIRWLPFTRYKGLTPETLREVTLPDGRRLALAFGRLQRTFPNFTLQLIDFDMIAFDHRGAPRDYQSRIKVTPTQNETSPSFPAYERRAKLNAPLRAPYVWDDQRAWLHNAAVRITAGLNPNQYKISQSGWDQSGWTQTQARADQGLIPEPYARFTIMQVGNNPGIHAIAIGGVMMALGIPWAFYIKPWMTRRERARFAAAASN
ncbi:MAG: hypothetical protein AAF297_05935 [Planctomycetota bacterium]